jgi:hypothetical protein
MRLVHSICFIVGFPHVITYEQKSASRFGAGHLQLGRGGACALRAAREATRLSGDEEGC